MQRTRGWRLAGPGFRICAAVWLLNCALPRAQAASGKGDGPRNGADGTVVWKDSATPGPAVALRLQHPVGGFLIYEGSLTRTQKGANSYEEADTFYVNVLCAEHKDGLDRLAIQRTFTDRKRTEIFENKRKLTPIPLDNPSELITFGPNSELCGTLRCCLFSAQNCPANRWEQVVLLKSGRRFQGQLLDRDAKGLSLLTAEGKIDLRAEDIASSVQLAIPHVMLNESPHYLFPAFSQRSVAPGETWRIKLPAIIPLEQGTPPRVLPTQFNVTLTGRLREVRNVAGVQVATVDYQVEGVFDSADDEYAQRFDKQFLLGNRIVHRLGGEGELTVDVEKGRILTKREDLKFTLYANSQVSQGADKPPKLEESKAEIEAKFEMRLLPPGTRLKFGTVVPDYDSGPGAGQGAQP